MAPTHQPHCVTRESPRRRRGGSAAGAARPSRLERAVGSREASGYKGVGEGVELLVRVRVRVRVRFRG